MKPKTFLFIVVLIVAAAGVVWWLERPRATPSSVAVAGDNSAQERNPLFRTTKPAPVAIQSVTNLDMETLSPAVRAVVDGRNNIRERLSGAKKLPVTFAEKDLRTLYAFLLERNARDSDQYGQALKNYVMDALCELNPPSLQLGDLLIQLYHDRSQDAVLRDYAVQHLAAYYEQLGKATKLEPQTKTDEETKVRGIFWESLSESDSSIAGTALLGLARLSEGRSEFDRDQIAAAALQLAGQAASGELTRITALQVCAGFGVKGALPLVIQTAQQGGETMPVRISAVGALGMLGGQEQTTLLDSLANGSEELLKAPARLALKRIQNRVQLAAQAPRKG